VSGAPSGEQPEQSRKGLQRTAHNAFVLPFTIVSGWWRARIEARLDYQLEMLQGKVVNSWLEDFQSPSLEDTERVAVLIGDLHRIHLGLVEE
jgi:hypothetical protein